MKSASNRQLTVDSYFKTDVTNMQVTSILKYVYTVQKCRILFWFLSCTKYVNNTILFINKLSTLANKKSSGDVI
jgi:hypothetical protein